MWVSIHRPINLYISAIVILLLIGLSLASLYEDEDRVNSEGMWQKPLKYHEAPVSSGHGNSRFDVGGILTAAGLKTGGSLLGLVVVPLLFPIVAVFSIALFIISMFGGVSPVIASGRRRIDNNENGVLSWALNLAVEVLGSKQCVERIGCEILDRMGHKTKLLSSVLQKLNYFPDSKMDKVEAAVTTGQSCSIFKCDVQDFIARTWG